MATVIPNLFLIGACRSGTTSLGRFLSGHPQVIWSNPSSNGYFADDIENYRYIRTEQDYLACYGSALGSTAYAGEGTTWYLYSQTAVRNILEFNPQAKFLAILRNPVEQLPSFHNILLTQGNEDVIDFEQAWNLRTERRANRHIPSKCSDYRFLDYGRTACYGTQVQRVFDLAGQDRVKVLLYEDYVSDTKSCYKEVLEFLGLEDDGRDDFPVVNPSRATQSRLLTHLTHKPSEFRQKWGSRIRNALNVDSLGVSKVLYAINSREKGRAPTGLSLENEIREQYRSEIELLSRLINTDLTHW